MNQRLSEAFGQYFVRLPLEKSATIRNENALRTNWNDVLNPQQCSYVLGNPPFVGKHLMTPEQNDDMELVWGDEHGAGILDYVTAWYLKAARYIRGSGIRVAFVSTNSAFQGEQVAALWSVLFRVADVRIDFAHTTFPWESEARGKAHVHVVIVGFSEAGSNPKFIIDYFTERQTDGKTRIEAKSHSAANISPYLFEGSNVLIASRSKPLADVPCCMYGSKPTDGGVLIVEDDARKVLLESSPVAAKYLRPLLCADEFINNIPRWCLWLLNARPEEWRNDPLIRARVEAVKQFRLKSKKGQTKETAKTPYLFAEIRQPATDFVVVPQHTSERRKYIPLGFFSPRYIVHNSCTAIPNATRYHFGVLSSAMFMAWIRRICGRIKSDFRFSTNLVYNNFPWPETPPAKQAVVVASKAQAVLDARAAFPESSLADLYDPLTMPAKLTKAHGELDRAVDACYQAKAFRSDRERVEFLFARYEKLTAPLTAGLKEPKRGRAKK